jgi:hypothetical protein
MKDYINIIKKNRLSFTFIFFYIFVKVKSKTITKLLTKIIVYEKVVIF